MKKFKKIFILVFVFLLGFTFVNAKAFNTNKNPYTDCVGADLSSYGAPKKTQICKLYSVTGDDTIPENTVFCLEVAKDIVYAAYTLENTKNNGLACAVLDVINNSSLSSAIGINAYDWNGSMNNKIYIDSYNNINLANFVTIQKYIWNHEKNGTGTCTAKNSETKNLTAGTLNTSTSTVTLTKQGDNFVGSFTVSSSNLINGYSYIANSSDVSLSKSGNTITITVPASKINSSKNYSITLEGTYNAKQTLTITPFVETYRCVVNEGTGCTNPTSHQSLGKIGFTRNITTTPSSISKVVNVVAQPEPTLTLKKVDTSGTVLGGATLTITKDGSTYNTVSLTNGTAIINSGLTYGKYCVTEVKAPEGYIKTNVSSCVTLSATNPNGTITITNKKTQVNFSKVDAVTNKELPGATLQILDKNKKEIKDKNGKVLYKWVSTDKPYIIGGLPVGIYYLKEIIQPKGYELSEEMVKFEVKADGSVTKVVMKNTPIIDVPDTALSKSALYGIVGGILALIGTGLIIYVVKRKKNSSV